MTVQTIAKPASPRKVKAPLALDLFCGGGGAGEGLIRAGFDVVGVDIADHSENYPGEFIQADALNPPVNLAGFDFIWASPPCQSFSRMTVVNSTKEHPNLIPATREMLESAGVHFAIENVPRAPIREDLRLAGPMLGLTRIRRERIFEASFPIDQPPIIVPPKITGYNGRMVGVTTSLRAPSHYYQRVAVGLPGEVPLEEAREAMDVKTPLTKEELGESIPPAYSAYIGQLALIAIEKGIRPCKRLL